MSGTARFQATRLRAPKRADLVAENIKRLVAQRELNPGDKLPQERELQSMFGVSKGTVREALKSLEVQGFITISTGPLGGATIAEVQLDRTLLFLQNYLFFKCVTMKDIYAARRLLEPELAAGAVLYLTDEDFIALKANIENCQPTSGAEARLIHQRQSDLDFHDVLAAANPDPFLRALCTMINEMLRRLVVYNTQAPADEHASFGRANSKCHSEILRAAQDRDVDKVRQLMRAHMDEAAAFVERLDGQLDGRLILESEINAPMRRDPSKISAGPRT